MSAYTIYKELFPPQAVEHVERCHFTDPAAVNLVVAKSSLLQIYEFVEYEPGSFGSVAADGAEEDENSDDNGRKDDEVQTLAYPKLKPLDHDIAGSVSGRLELVAQYKLNGCITSMGVIRTLASHGREGYDSLLLAFDDAKMSLLEWSTAVNSIETTSIHYYERDELKKEFLSNPYPPSIHVDPQQRCAVLNFYNNQLAILPFRPTNMMMLGDETESQSKLPYFPSILSDMTTIEIPNTHTEMSKTPIKNIIDMVFLSGYNEPTLAVLFQTEQTWTGRLSSTKDTVSIAVMELDLSTQRNDASSARKHTVIYALHKLPYDCFKLVPMPKPVDGILVLSANSILHVPQGSPPIGVALSGYTKKTTDFPGMIYADSNVNLGLALEGARALPVGGTRCLLFLQNGDWAVIQVKMDGSKVVGMNVTLLPLMAGMNSGTLNVPTIVIPTCVTAVKDDEYFFLGSRGGDSQLIKWDHQRDLGSSMAVSETDFTFRVCDSLLNTGPIKDLAVGVVESTKSHQEASAIPDLELVSCSGQGKSGSLCIFHRNVRPTSSISFSQDDCQAIWSVKYRKEQYVDDVKVHGNMHENATNTIGDASGHWGSADTGIALNSTFDKLLFISKSTSTLVFLLSGDELVEVEQNIFYKKGPTITVGTLFDYTCIVQVHSRGVILLSPEGKLLKTVPVKESKIIDACINDPYIILTLENNTLMALRGDEKTKEVNVVSLPSNVNKHPVATASIFADISGMFLSISEKIAMISKAKKTKLEKTNTQEHKRKTDSSFESAPATKKTSPPSNTANNEFDDVDMFLYGYQGDAETAQDEKMEEASTAMVTESNKDDDDDMLYRHDESAVGSEAKKVAVDETNVSMIGNVTEPMRVSFWCLVYTKNGALQIYSLPDFNECFAFPQFNNLPDLLNDHPVQDNTFSQQSSTTPETSNSQIKEIILADIGRERRDPHIVARTTDGGIAIYKAFGFVATEASVSTEGQDSTSRLALRFSRVHHDYLPRKPVPSDGVHANQEEFEGQELLTQPIKVRRRALIPFSNVAGYAGVFVTGKQPAWLICSCKSFVRVHPMKTEREVVGFTQFHNSNCKHGFITVDTKSESNIKMCNLPADNVTYDLDWVVRKQVLHQTPHNIKYHPTMNIYAVTVSRPETVRLRLDEGEPIDQQEQRMPGEFLPSIERYEMWMVSPVTWETVDRRDFEEYEQALSLECLTLETNLGKDHFIVVGTGFLRGEDAPMRGHVYIYETIEVVPEEDNPQTNHKFKLLCKEEVKNAVTALCEVSHHLVCCTGSKVVVYRFEEKESLVGVAFMDVEIYVTSMSSIKNYILLGDAQKSICLLGFQLENTRNAKPNEQTKLVLLGKDFQSFEVASVGYLIYDNALYLLVGDTEDNIDIFQYAPSNLQSRNGEKLIRRGDFHVGTQVRSMMHLPQIEYKSEGPEYNQRHFCLCGSFSGSISVVSPISEKTFKRLNTLYGQLVNGYQQIAGLNPRAFRLIKGSKQRMSSNRTRAVLDGDIIFKFTGLALDTQREVTRHIGSTVPMIMGDLIDIESSISHF